MNKKKLIIVLSIVLILILGVVYININNLEKEKSINISNERRDEEMYIKINNEILKVNLENNSSVDSLLEKLEDSDITINMHDYANFEKVGSLGFDLPRNDREISTDYGDIILYQGNQFVIYYDKNSWSFTKLGHIDNINQKELKELLGESDVEVTITLNKD